MKGLAVLLAVGLAVWAGMALAFPDYTHRYRLTVEVDTPQGVRSGSSVTKDERWFPIGGRYVYRVRGEAVFVDLGEGRNLFALLAFGPRAENVDQMIPLRVEAYGHYRWDGDAWSARTKLQGPVELKPPLIPTLVSFSNPSGPKTACIVQQDEFEQVFGPDVRFRRAAPAVSSTCRPRWPSASTRTWSRRPGATSSSRGHSMGAGHAGVVGALFGKEAALYDNMPFQLAARRGLSRLAEHYDLSREARGPARSRGIRAWHDTAEAQAA